MMCTVGPSTNTTPASAAAAIRLPTDSSLTPRATPLTDEVTNSTVTTAMMPTCHVGPTGSPNTVCSPLLICAAPTPSDAATPNAVATTASTLKAGVRRRAQAQGSVSVAELTSAGAPRRNWKYAIASPTMP